MLCLVGVVALLVSQQVDSQSAGCSPTTTVPAVASVFNEVCDDTKVEVWTGLLTPVGQSSIIIPGKNLIVHGVQVSPFFRF